MVEGLRLARREAEAGFGDDRVYLEKYLDRPRHIEFQVLADHHGRCIHLGERDCSVQRRHQKVIEEAPSTVLDEATRAKVGRRVTDGLAKLGYRGAGTVEFLYQDGELYFIEMNTRLQVEHPVTEMITGIDLVRAQIEIAAGAPLALAQSDVRFDGHAIECRINAEDPKSLLPTPGRVEAYHAPGGPGVRVDSALYAGARVPPYYDSLIAKLIVHDRSRAACLRRLRRALGGVRDRRPADQHSAAAGRRQGSGVRRGRLPHRLAGRVPEGLAGRKLTRARRLALCSACSLCQKPCPR